ncbi:MAG: 3-phosphoshikimate 1-carboxyvinyltransferase [Clostridia bacterium]|nr:3-phosphoshikimate 1-carboxyvinyltransferase [Clostridia bacterium]
MKLQFIPGRAVGTVPAPASKSMSHRLLIAAGMAPGKSVITGLGESEDVLATMDCLRALGCEAKLEGDTATVVGRDPRSMLSGTLPCRECGSTLRFFIPIALLSPGQKTFTGSKRLMERPLDVYEELFQKQNITMTRGDGTIALSGKLSGGDITLRGDVSSQFISGLLFALPALPEGGTLHLLPPVESRSYIDLTLSALRDFGIRADWTDETTLHIPGGQTYCPCTLRVEGDWSNAAFLHAFSAIGGDVKVENLRDDSLQGDRVCVAHLESLQKGFAEIDLADCPDLGPVLMAVAAMKHGARFINTRRLRIKECDRGTAMQDELSKFGIPVTVADNEITVHPAPLNVPTARVDGHNDHRIVMAMSLPLSVTGGVLTGAEAVRKSYPEYFSVLKTLSLEVEKYGMEFES